MARSRRDVGLLFATRIIRMFAYGALSVVLALYLAEIGLDEKRIGLLFTLTLATTVVSIVVHGISVTPLMARYERIRGPKA